MSDRLTDLVAHFERQCLRLSKTQRGVLTVVIAELSSGRGGVSADWPFGKHGPNASVPIKVQHVRHYMGRPDLSIEAVRRAVAILARGDVLKIVESDGALCTVTLADRMRWPE